VQGQYTSTANGYETTAEFIAELNIFGSFLRNLVDSAVSLTFEMLMLHLWYCMYVCIY